MSGTATESQILEALRRYPNRPVYVQKCLYNLFRQTSYFNEARVDVIKLVIPGMRAHPQEFRVQMAATACLYNLTKGELATKIHPSVLKQIVDLTLTAMESYPNHYQLQKNTLLTLCSDRILQDVAFDKYRYDLFVCVLLVLFNPFLRHFHVQSSLTMHRRFFSRSRIFQCVNVVAKRIG